MNIRFAVFTAPLLLAIAVSGSQALAADKKEEPAKPNCPKGQVWDSKSQKCLMQNNSLIPPAKHIDFQTS